MIVPASRVGSRDPRNLSEADRQAAGGRNLFGVAPHDAEERHVVLTVENAGRLLAATTAGGFLVVLVKVGGGGGHKLVIKKFDMVVHYY